MPPGKLFEMVRICCEREFGKRKTGHAKVRVLAVLRHLEDKRKHWIWYELLKISRFRCRIEAGNFQSI
jgi:hypothetical protein